MKDYWQSLRVFLRASIVRWAMLIVSVFVAVAGVITLYILPSFKLGSFGLIIVAALAWFLACFQAYHNLLKEKKVIEARLQNFHSLYNELTRTIRKADMWKQEFSDGSADYEGFDRLIADWNNEIRALLKIHLPTYSSEFERLLKLPTSLVIHNVESTQKWLKSIQDTLAP